MGNADAAKQRLLDLKVNEVSLVDHPANEAEFLVRKSLGSASSEDNAMGTDTENKTPAADLDAVQKSILALSEVLKAKGKGKMPPWMEDEEGDDDDSKKRKADLRKAWTEVNEAVAALAEPAPVAKATETEEPTPGTHIHVQPDGSVVLKGGPQFSKKRTEALKSAVASMLGVMKDADPSGFAEVMSSFAPTGAAPLAPALKSEPAPAPAPAPAAAPKADDPVMKALETITGAVETISKRLEAVEKSQTVSKSLGDDTNNKVSKGDKNFWAGVL